MSEIERMLEENRKLREENAKLLAGRQKEGTSKKIKSSPRLFAPGRTLYPARWRNLLNDNDKDKNQEAKGVVGEVLDIESVLTQNDEIDDSFLRALQVCSPLCFSAR